MLCPVGGCRRNPGTCHPVSRGGAKDEPGSKNGQGPLHTGTLGRHGGPHSGAEARRTSRGKQKRVWPPPRSYERTRGEKVPWMNLVEENRAFVAWETGVLRKAEGRGLGRL